MEIACDESGFVGGSLFGGIRVFAHASLRIDLEEAGDIVDEVRRRTAAGPGELKASRLNRPWARPVAAWLCGPRGPVSGRAVVHATDTRLFGLARLCQLLTSDRMPEGWLSADDDADVWELARTLDRVLARLDVTWAGVFLDRARDLLWVNRKAVPATAVDAWLEVAAATAEQAPDPAARAGVALLATAEAAERARAYRAAPPVSPLTEPLLPAVRWAVHHWSAFGNPFIVHDEQSLLTPVRVQAIADELARSCAGRRVAGFRRVDSRDDARLQLADLLAGTVRRSLEDQLEGDSALAPVPVDHLLAEGSLWVRG